MSSPEDSTTKPAHHHRIRLNDMLWGPTLAILGMHASCAFAPMTFSWGALGVAVLFWWLAGGIGVCLGYHRLLTHRSFETPRFLEYLITTLGSMSWQGGPIRWVGTHRMHHRDSDTDADPHSPKHGFTWAHVLWCLTRDPLRREPRDLAPDLKRDAFHRFIDRHFYLPQVGLGAVLWMLGGWSWVIWGVCVRTVFSYHATWFVNSAAHTWGYRNFDTRENSRNNWWVALLSFGEGWHNNHHAFARSARHGMRWWEIDLTWWTIKAMEKIGLAWNVHVPAAEAVRGD